MPGPEGGGWCPGRAGSPRLGRPHADRLSRGCLPAESPWVSPPEKAELDQLPVGKRQPAALPEAICLFCSVGSSTLISEGWSWLVIPASTLP